MLPPREMSPRWLRPSPRSSPSSTTTVDRWLEAQNEAAVAKQATDLARLNAVLSVKVAVPRPTTSTSTTTTTATTPFAIQC
jgi:hypothetical protein